ncbi:MAG TPA: peroxiredoxin [Thermoplasmata archaeon]|nr:peroxiredoxin [Thermoplasmata archaeon]
MSSVSVGELAPDFEAPTQDGNRLKLSALRGHPVVLYFYPKADTPGCTIESKSFRDSHPEFQAHDVQVVGVSVDDVPAQLAFAEKYSLPFPLVADVSKEIARRYGVLNPSGRARRVTFYIDTSGKIVRIVDNSSPGPHVEQAKELFLKN